MAPTGARSRGPDVGGWCHSRRLRSGSAKVLQKQPLARKKAEAEAEAVVVEAC